MNESARERDGMDSGLKFEWVGVVRARDDGSTSPGSRWDFRPPEQNRACCLRYRESRALDWEAEILVIYFCSRLSLSTMMEIWLGVEGAQLNLDRQIECDILMCHVTEQTGTI